MREWELRAKAGLAGLVLAASCLALASFNSGGAKHVELNELNFLNDYSMHTDNIAKKLEKYRIERDVALATIGHPSLTAIPRHSPKANIAKLKEIRRHALSKLDRLSRGRHPIGDFGLKQSDPLKHAAHPDCDPGDARLGLCGVYVPPPSQQELSDAEEKVNQQLEKKEQQSDQERKKIMAQINQKRIEKAQDLMKKLTSTDDRINELVHHAVKVLPYFQN